MKYGRCVVEKGDIWDNLAGLRIDKVAVPKDILEWKLSEEEISNARRTELRNELGGIRERWKTSRNEEADQKKRHLPNSYEWDGIEKRDQRRDSDLDVERAVTKDH